MAVFLSAAGLLLLSPVIALAAVAVKLDSRGPAIFRAKRIGRGGRPFIMLKFRTMAENAASGPPVTGKGDPRVTAVGRFLRKTKLDELPQLVNVLRGDMGFVGPRPEDPAVAARYPESLKGIFAYRPGITSPASLAFRSEEEMIPAGRWEAAYFGEILQKKVKADLAYMENANWRKDLALMVRTVLKK